MYKLLFLIFLYSVINLCTFVVTDSNNIYRMQLIRRKSPLEMMHKDPNYMKKMNIAKNTPKNENITLFKYLDSEYYAEILVGKPGQKFTVIFDTTWGDMWLPSKFCSSDMYPVCGTKHLYDSNASSTHKSVDPQPFELHGLVGNLTCDTVRLPHLNVSDLIFAEIREINGSDYQMMHADGVIGLGFNTIARTTNTPFFYKLLGDKKILKPIFSLYMNRDKTTPKGGIIFLGGIEPRHINSTITYVPVTVRNYWQITMKQFSVQINKTYAKTFCDKTCQVILDTSTNVIGVPHEHVISINTLIGAVEYKYNRYRVSCSLVKKLPTITLSIGDRDFHISGRYYIQQIENQTDGMICLTAFSDAGLPNGLWSLGGAFLSSVYTTFDFERNRVGFADLTGK